MSETSGWDVRFYIDARGRSPVRAFLDSLPVDVEASLFRAIDLLVIFGPLLRMPHARKVRGDIWELRAGQGRLFYFAHTGRQFIILHGYVKKSQRAPRQEIDTAVHRWQDFVSRAGD